MSNIRTLASDLVIRWPELARRVNDAVRLVEEGRVWRDTGADSVFHVLGLTYDKAAGLCDIDAATVVTVGDYLSFCDCPDYENGVAGYFTPYPPRVELSPGFSSICCCHVLAVHIARMIESDNNETQED